MILPKGSSLTLTIGATSLTLFVDEVRDTFLNQGFERTEFSYDRLLQAPNLVDGSMPVIIYGFGNVPVQITSTCSSITPRVLLPDDAVVGSVKQRFNIHQYELVLSENLAATIDSIASTAQTHANYLARFDADMGKRSMKVSYEQLITWQSETFSYLTSTTVSMSGSQVPSESNLLITNYQRGVLVEVPGTTQDVVLKGGSLTLQVRAISSAIS